MKKSDRNLLQARLAQISKPSPTQEDKPDATDEINALFGGGSLPRAPAAPLAPAPSLPSTPNAGHAPNAPNAEQPSKRPLRNRATHVVKNEARGAVAPAGDFQRVANSIVREAVPAGYFTGKGKQLYDYLYQQTRGAIVPTRSVRIPKKRLMKGAGIGSDHTLMGNLDKLAKTGLIEIEVIDGVQGGNRYTVNLPEEIGLPSAPNAPNAEQAAHQPNAGQKLPPVPPVETDLRAVGVEATSTTVYGESKTFSKDLRANSDDEALADLVRDLKKAALEITGKETNITEAARWRELGEVLITELKIAAARTTVSSAPAFLSEHLRRRLWKKDKKQLSEEGSNESSERTQPKLRVDASKCPDCGGSGMYYPEGYEKGVAKCSHEKLTAES